MDEFGPGGNDRRKSFFGFRIKFGNGDKQGGMDFEGNDKLSMRILAIGASASLLIVSLAAASLLESHSRH